MYTYTLQVIRLSENKFGIIQIQNLRKGQYTFANKDVKALSIKQNYNSGKVKVYPNPSNGILNFDFSNLNAKRLEIYNSKGQLIKNEVLEKDTYQLSLPSGNFIYKLYTKNDIYSGLFLVK